MRQKILRELAANQDRYISGNELALRLGISRVAVWKHIEALKSDGYEINSVRGKGYYLTNKGVIIPEEIEERLKGQLIGSRIIFFPRIDSSNDKLKLILRQKWVQEGTVCAAQSQNKGKGRRGRVWESPPVDCGFLSYCVRSWLYPRFLCFH